MLILYTYVQCVYTMLELGGYARDKITLVFKKYLCFIYAKYLIMT